MDDVVGRIIEHPIRKRLIEALWHSSEPLSARRFHSEYSDGTATLATISYHVCVLEHDGVAEVARVDGDEMIERFVVLAGPNCAEAVRRLGLT
ncbi:MAG: helix-turn-helix transcriptional regulator [Actinobacteria bacterium]|nr:helix-turn-helix transcriptional regulator [Actinomycetota bacterium]